MQILGAPIESTASRATCWFIRIRELRAHYHRHVFMFIRRVVIGDRELPPTNCVLIVGLVSFAPNPWKQVRLLAIALSIAMRATCVLF